MTIGVGRPLVVAEVGGVVNSESSSSTSSTSRTVAATCPRVSSVGRLPFGVDDDDDDLRQNNLPATVNRVEVDDDEDDEEVLLLLANESGEVERVAECTPPMPAPTDFLLLAVEW